MKERVLKLIESVGYPYKRVSAVDKKELVAIHKQLFRKSNDFYSNLGCDSCVKSMLNDLVIKYNLKQELEPATDYKKRLAICFTVQLRKVKRDRFILVVS